MGWREVYEDERVDDYISGWIDEWKGIYVDAEMCKKMEG